MLANACSIPFGAVFRAGRDLSFYLYHIISGKIHESNTNHDGLESSVGEHTVAGGRLRVAWGGESRPVGRIGLGFVERASSGGALSGGRQSDGMGAAEWQPSRAAGTGG